MTGADQKEMRHVLPVMTPTIVDRQRSSGDTRGTSGEIIRVHHPGCSEQSLTGGPEGREAGYLGDDSHHGQQLERLPVTSRLFRTILT